MDSQQQIKRVKLPRLFPTLLAYALVFSFQRIGKREDSPVFVPEWKGVYQTSHQEWAPATGLVPRHLPRVLTSDVFSLLLPVGRPFLFGARVAVCVDNTLT